MIEFRNTADRLHHSEPDGGRWTTFNVNGWLGPLRQFEEHLLSPGSGPRAWAEQGELLTYVHRGCVTCERAGRLQATEAQLVTGGLSPWRVCNSSKSEQARVFQLTFAPSALRRVALHAQRRFTVAERREQWRLIASPDARDGSLLLFARARVYSTLLHDGFHVVHALEPGCAAWLHVIEGACVVSGWKLQNGDAAAFTEERSVSLTARGDTELLLVEVVTG